jgi:hypothetical protein
VEKGGETYASCVAVDHIACQQCFDLPFNYDKCTLIWFQIHPQKDGIPGQQNHPFGGDELTLDINVT